MRILILILAWITPAIIAGILGWKGIWGSGSALLEYLIPMPVAGGVMHVPSFVVAAIIMTNLKNYPQRLAQTIPLIAIGVCLAAQTLQLDFEDLNAWIFTDYEPARSVFRFRGNPLLLFITTDAIWVALYAMALGYTSLLRYGLLLPLVPIGIIGVEAVQYKIQGPVISYEYSRSAEKRGNEYAMVYTSVEYDQQLFQQWYEEDNIVSKPWENQNAEHTAVYFSRSMQALKWGNADTAENIVGTICLYEEDESMTIQPGYYDCFSDRITIAEKLNESLNTTSTGLGKEVDKWFALVRLCEGVVIPDDYTSYIELTDLCISMKRKFPTDLENITQQFGEDSEQVRFLRTNANILGL